MRKYDFEKMGGIWKDYARTITEKGVFVASSGNWDLWEYSGTVYSIPVCESGCRASAWCKTSRLKMHLEGLKNIMRSNSLIPDDWENINSDFLNAI